MKLNTIRLELLAAQRGMGVCDLADKTGISRQTLSTIKGRKTCRATTAVKLALALNVPVESIIENED